MNALYKQKKASIEEVHNPNKFKSKTTVVVFDDEDDILGHHTQSFKQLSVGAVNTNNEADFPSLGSSSGKTILGAAKSQQQQPQQQKKQQGAPIPWSSVAKPASPNPASPSLAASSQAAPAWGGGVVLPPSFPTPAVQPPAFQPHSRAQQPQPQPQSQQPQHHMSNPVSPMPSPVHQYQAVPSPSGSFAPPGPMRSVPCSLISSSSLAHPFLCA